MGRLSEVLDRIMGRGLYEMANVAPKRTGLPYGIWISHRGSVRHGPRIKAYAEGYQVRASEIVVSIEEVPRVIRVPVRHRVPAAHLHQLEAFVRLNRAVLLQYWEDDDMDTQDMIEQLKRVES